jgi:alcohol dehydrogenase (cytochrome c)
LTAVDADTGKVLWKYHAALPLVAALTTTAGGIVFTGDLEGHLLAFDAASGKLLLKTLTSGPIGGGITTYMVGDTQYVAVAAGMKNEIMKTESGPAAIIIYSLGAHASSKGPG